MGFLRICDSLRFSAISPRSLSILHSMPASSQASRHAASSCVFSSVSQPPLGRTQPLRLEDWMRRTWVRSEESGTTPATRRSPPGPYLLGM